MIVPIPYVHMAMGVLMIVLSIPLVLGKIPMNCVYGIRIRKAFASQSNWYAINAYGGKVLLGFGLFLAVFGHLGRDVAPPPTSIWAPLFLIVPLLALVPVAVLISVFARRLPDL
jgi:hypothetical protein